MIKNDEEYRTSKKALEDAENALMALKKKVYDLSIERYQLIAEPYVDYINKLRFEINEYIGLASAEENSIPLWLRLKGPHIGTGNVPLVILTEFLNNFKLGTQRIAEYLESKTIREVGRPKEEIRRFSNFKVKILPGSLRIGLSFPSPGKQMLLDLETNPNLIEDSVKKILDGISWVVGVDNRELEEIFPNPEERYLILNQIDKISPKPDGEISSIEFRGRFLKNRELYLSPNHSNKIKNAMYKSIPPQNVVEEGDSREIDLDKRRFYLRNRSNGKKDIQCLYQSELEDDAINGLNKRVKVMGTLHKPEKQSEYIKIVSINIIDVSSS